MLVRKPAHPWSGLFLILLLSACYAQNNASPVPARPASTRLAATRALPAAGPAPAPTGTRPAPTATQAAGPRVVETATRPVPTATVPAQWVSIPPGRVSVPILLYHNISEKGSSRYGITPAQFRREMALLHELGYETITISQLSDVIRRGGSLPEKPVVLTFDDGFLGVYEHALPVMQEYGYAGVVYVITGTLGTEKAYGYLQEPQLEELIAQGWEIGSHSISHHNLKTTPLGIRSEIEASKTDLEERFGVRVRSFSYPYAVANAWIRAQIEEYGYDSAVGIDIFMTHSPNSLYFLSRKEIPRGLSLDEFAALLLPGQYEVAALPFATPENKNTPTPEEASPGIER